MFESLLEMFTGDVKLSADEAGFITSLWTPRRFRKGEFFQHPGETTTRGGFVVEGCFRTPLVVPHARYFTTRVAFSAEDFAAAKQSMTCHRTQFTPDVVERVMAASGLAWKGAIPLIPAFARAGAVDLFE